MPGSVEITPWHWAGFILVILFFLALDLGVFNRRDHVVRFKEAAAWTACWVTLTLIFAASLLLWRSRHEAVQFVTGYVIELSLSMDNVFIMALIFSFFRVPVELQHRVLFWGVLGALAMRGVMIVVGAELVARFSWTLYVFGFFLLFTGFRMLFSKTEGVDPEKNPLVRAARKIFPVSVAFEGRKFLTRLDGRFALTPLALVLVMVETTDLLFAVDSIPAIFSVTTNSFIVFTSNVFAILGLRSLYFVLAGAIEYFRHLKVGLSFAVIFIGVKMLIDPHDNPPKWFQFDIPTSVALLVVAGILLIAVALSITATWREKKVAAT